MTTAHVCHAHLHNALGAHAEARDAALLATASPEETGIANLGLVELVEACALSGDQAGAQAALERLTARTGPSGTPWALGVDALCRALVTGSETRFREAVDHLAASRAAVLLARAHLLYGEKLHRDDRVTDARAQLLAARDLFTRFGAEAFTARADRALTAAGVAPRPVTTPVPVEFTTREHEIAVRARAGQSNVQIGAELFLSTRTVEWHLRKIFAKLHITSRRDLADQAF